MSIRIEGWVRAFLETPGRYAALATVEPSGEPLQVVVWYALRADAVLVNSRLGRRWPANLLRDPRASLIVFDAEDYVLLQGLAERLHEGDAALADISALARAYEAPAKAEQSIRDFATQERISFLLRPDAILVHR